MDLILLVQAETVREQTEFMMEEIGMRSRLGEYEDFFVTRDGVRRLVADVIDEAHASRAQASFAQLAPIGAYDDACGHGVNLYCRVEPPFSLTIRLDWVLGYAANIQQIATGYLVEHRGNTPHSSRWLVTFASPEDPIAAMLYQVLQEICGCGEGEQTCVYWPDPGCWDEDSAEG